jgi:hypothetical protein
MVVVDLDGRRGNQQLPADEALDPAGLHLAVDMRPDEMLVLGPREARR